jgi:orotate phosphoribosyltransferase
MKTKIDRGIIPSEDLFTEVSAITGLQDAEVCNVITTYFEKVLDRLSKGYKVWIPPIGSIYSAQLNNPKRFIPQFSPYKSTKEASQSAGQKYLEEKLIVLLKNQNVVKHGDFIFSLGQRSDYKIDLDDIITHKPALDLITDLMIPEIKKSKADVVIGQISNGDIIAKEIARKLGINYAVYYKNPQSIKGPYSFRAWLVDDVSTTDNSVDMQWKFVEPHVEILGATVVVANNPETTKHHYVLAAEKLLK